MTTGIRTPESGGSRGEPRSLPPVLIRASAGTGKTFRLSHHYLMLLAMGVEPQRILATTFTRKAAGEIQSRVLGRLAAAAKGDPATLREMRKYSDPAITAAKARELLAKVVRNLHHLNISTLDAFFIRVAKSYSLELGLPPGWAVLDDIADARFRNEATRAVLNENDPQRVIDLIRLLTPGQTRRSVHEQVVDVVDSVYKVYQRQPERAAWTWLEGKGRLSDAELEKKIDGLLRMEPPGSKAAKTAWECDIQRAIAHEWGKFVDTGLAGKIVDPESNGTFRGWVISKDTVAFYRPLITHAKAVLLADLAGKTRATYDLLAEFDGRYREMKHAARAMKFEDVTLGLAGGALGGRLDEVYYRLDGRIDHLLLDEFQDTSLPQWQVLFPIADEVVQDSEGRRSFFCVGDVKQAIYGWRGGQAEIFDTVQSTWSITPEPLNETQRCRKAVVAAVNKVFITLGSNTAIKDPHRPMLGHWAHVGEHTTAKDDVVGYVRMLTANRAGEGQDPRAVTLACAAKIVQQAMREAPGMSIGVLVRKNDAVARVIFELRQLGIRASEEGGNPLTDTPAVCVVVSLLRLADHPGDSAAAFHVRHSPLGPIVGFTNEQAAAGVATRVRSELLETGYGPTIQGWVQRLENSGACDERDLTRLSQLVELARKYDEKATLRTGDFVRVVEETRIADPTGADVRVMNAHQAKGLEFDIVVLPELDSRLMGQGERVLVDRGGGVTQAPPRVTAYPNEAQRDLDPRLQEIYDGEYGARLREAMSVLYVMMTRPKYALHILIAPSVDTDKRKEKTIPATGAGILRAALTPGQFVEPRTQLYAEGDKDWYKKRKDKKKEATGPVEPPAALALARGASRRRMLPHVSPSGVGKSDVFDAASVFRLDSGRGRSRGETVHGMLEKLEWVESFSVSDEALGRQLHQPEIHNALARSAYPADAGVTVLREEPFAVRRGDGILTGTFDRLVLVRRGGRIVAAEIVDYKTDSVTPEMLAGKTEEYKPQMEAYRAAAAAIYKLDPAAIRLKLLFLSAGKVVEL